MSHEEWNGYLVKKGVDAKSCGFVMPKDRPKYYKEKKLESVPIIDQIKSMLTKLTQGFTDKEKTNFLFQKLDVNKFSDLALKNDNDLIIYMNKLKALK